MLKFGKLGSIARTDMIFFRIFAMSKFIAVRLPHLL